MGNTFQRAINRDQDPEQENILNDEEEDLPRVQAVRGGHKRSHEDENVNAELEMLMHTPKKKKLKTTSR